MSTTTISELFVEADSRSEWWQAINESNCGKAMRLFREDRTLSRRTGPNGRTALHAAVIGGWGHEVVEFLLGMSPQLQSTGGAISSSRVQDFRLARDLLEAEDGEYNQKAVTIAAVIGSTKVVRSLIKAYEIVEGLYKEERNYQSYIYKRYDEHTNEMKSREESWGEEKSQRESLRQVVNALISEDDNARNLRDRYFLKAYCKKAKDFHSEDPEYVFHVLCTYYINYDKCVPTDSDDSGNPILESPADVSHRTNIPESRPRLESMRRIVNKVAEKDASLVPFLFKLQNNLGMTPLHAAISSGHVEIVKLVLELIPAAGECAEACVNALDGAGRTPLHRAAAASVPKFCDESDMSDILEKLLQDPRTHLNGLFEPLHYFFPRELEYSYSPLNSLIKRLSTTSGNYNPSATYRLTNLTPLHLSIIHNRLDRMRKFVNGSRKCSKIGAKKESLEDYYRVFAPPGWMDQHYFTEKDWVPLDTVIYVPLIFMAALLRNHKALQVLFELEDTTVHDRGATRTTSAIKSAGATQIKSSIESTSAIQTKSSIESTSIVSRCPISVLHLASSCGYPEMLEIILDSKKIDPMVRDSLGHTALHYAAYALPPNFDLQLVEYYVDLKALLDYKSNRQRLEKEGYSGKMGCINILLQEGLEVWDKGSKGNSPSPGSMATEDVHVWWHDKADNATKEAKKSLMDATNAVAVTGALVATTSFIGPLQPPLGYDPSHGGLDYEHVSVRAFIICVNLSFYVVLASIMLSLLPSLPVPKASMHSELRRTRNIVIVAVSLLLVSILFVLMAFAAATFAVLPKKEKALTLAPTISGAIIGVIVIVLFVFRLLRLVYYGSPCIRRLYDRLELF